LSRSADQWRPRRGKQTVRLAVVPAFARLWLLPRLEQLEGNDIHVDLLLGHRPSDLEGEADLAIRYGRGVWDGLRATLLFAETLRPVASGKLAQALGKNCTAERLLRSPLVHDSDVTHWRSWLGGEGLTYRPRWQDRRFEDYDSVLAAAKSGLAIALFRKPLVGLDPSANGLSYVSARSEANPSSHFLCMRSDEGRSAVLELATRITALPTFPNA
jgi:DNA-binding transcriptional LysR family regulator